MTSMPTANPGTTVTAWCWARRSGISSVAATAKTRPPAKCWSALRTRRLGGCDAAHVTQMMAPATGGVVANRTFSSGDTDHPLISTGSGWAAREPAANASPQVRALP